MTGVAIIGVGIHPFGRHEGVSGAALRGGSVGIGVCGTAASTIVKVNDRCAITSSSSPSRGLYSTWNR